MAPNVKPMPEAVNKLVESYQPEVIALYQAEVPTESGVYFDNAGKYWFLTEDGYLYDGSGTTREKEYNWIAAKMAGPFTSFEQAVENGKVASPATQDERTDNFWD